MLEVGMDVGYVVTVSVGQTDMDIGLPLRHIRASIPVSGRWSAEFQLGYAYEDDRNTEGGRTNLGLQAFVVRDLFAAPGRAHPFLRAGTGLDYGRLPVGTAVTQPAIWAGFGFKLPVSQAVELRMEATYGHAFQAGSTGAGNTLSTSAGITTRIFK